MTSQLQESLATIKPPGTPFGPANLRMTLSEPDIDELADIISSPTIRAWRNPPRSYQRYAPFKAARRMAVWFVRIFAVISVTCVILNASDDLPELPRLLKREGKQASLQIRR